MAEQSLYRRHRPQSFADVVGQEHVVRTLSNAITRDRVHHAYLFVGSRGTGKTSMAKILARSLNCVQGPTLTPCGECDSCRSIANGSSMDVIEMDAASNRSVDDIRDLRERVGYAAPEGRWKVYILDEAHMLTREAWNAFLKTLEEPPPRTAFVLATTEPHKVMPTIIDRCQRFDFGRPPPEEIAVVVRRAAQAEGLTLADGAVGAIARAANGSFRDALGTLDQLVAYSGTDIATEDVLAMLGVADSQLLYGAADAIAAGDGRAALAISASLARSGHDPSRFAADLVAHLRQLLVIGTLGEVPDHFLVAPEDEAPLTEQAGRLGEAAILRGIDELSAAVTAVREGDEARMTVELALLRAARPELDPSRAAMTQRIERLEQASAGGTRAPAPAASPEPKRVAPPATEPEPSRAQPTVERARQPAPSAGVAEAPQGSSPQPAEPAPEPESPSEPRPSAAAPAPEPEPHPPAPEPDPPPAAAPLDLDRLSGLWPAVLDEMREGGAGMLSAAIGAARPVSVDPEAGSLRLGFPPSAAFNRRKAEVKENRERIGAAVTKVVGAPLRIDFATLEEEDAAAGAAVAEREPADENELYERFLTEFDAEVVIEDEPKETS